MSSKDKIVNEAYARSLALRKKGYWVQDQLPVLKEWLEEHDEVVSVSVHGDTVMTIVFKDQTQAEVHLGRNRSNWLGGWPWMRL